MEKQKSKQRNKATVSVTFNVDVDLSENDMYNKEKWQMKAYDFAYEYINRANLTDADSITIKLKQNENQ